MMDAYDLKQAISDAWRPLALNHSADDIKKSWPVIPVYVEINGELKAITDIKVEDNKIIAGTK